MGARARAFLRGIAQSQGMTRAPWVVLVSAAAGGASLDGLTSGSPSVVEAGASGDDAAMADAPSMEASSAPLGDSSSDGEVAVDASACDAGMAVCNGACVDLGTDPNNCGACGNVCTVGTCTAVLN